MPMPEDIHDVYCSFCDKPQMEVHKLVAAKDNYICNECIDLCYDILHEGEPNFKKMWFELYEVLMTQKGGNNV